jgi:hypothetical protein
VRRVVATPVDVAWVKSGDRSSASAAAAGAGAMPAVFVLGRSADGDATLFLRFALSLPKDVKVLEAYLLLIRSSALDADPAPIYLHAARVVEPWDSRSISWAAQPRIEDVRAPATRVDPGGRALVRVDVRALVEGWALHDRRDHGVALVAENTSATGIPFAFLPVGLPLERPAASPAPALGFGAPVTGTAPVPADEAPPEPIGPRLELYLK